MFFFANTLIIGLSSYAASPRAVYVVACVPTYPDRQAIPLKRRLFIFNIQRLMQSRHTPEYVIGLGQPVSATAAVCRGAMLLHICALLRMFLRFFVSFSPPDG